ncbi:MAG: hypothetical protein COB56_06960 [Robiginitomaculum sp.]|nr:MAG: hypothetical protein COB56_06960 [Robiginitomaculum sp.]
MWYIIILLSIGFIISMAFYIVKAVLAISYSLVVAILTIPTNLRVEENLSNSEQKIDFDSNWSGEENQRFLVEAKYNSGSDYHWIVKGGVFGTKKTKHLKRKFFNLNNALNDADRLEFHDEADKIRVKDLKTNRIILRKGLFLIF